MKIIVNGNEKVFKEASSIASVLSVLHLEGKVMAAAVNMEIVKQDKWDEYILKEEDSLELLDFVGGG